MTVFLSGTACPGKPNPDPCTPALYPPGRDNSRPQLNPCPFSARKDHRTAQGQLGGFEILVADLFPNLAGRLVAQGIRCIGSMVGHDGQPAVPDEESLSLGVEVGLGFPVTVPVAADGGIINRSPRFPVEPGAGKFVLPHQPVGRVGGMGLPGSRGRILRALDPGRRSGEKDQREQARGVTSPQDIGVGEEGR